METRSVSFDLSQVRALRVDVASPGAASCRGHVRGVSSDKLRARFPVTGTMLALGSPVSLRFSGNELKQVISSTANVLERRDEDRHREYLFELTKPEEIVPVLLPHIQKVGNRRGAVRIRPKASIHVTLTLESSLSIRAGLFDISASGMSLRVTPDQEAAIAQSTKVEVRAKLPGRPSYPLCFRAWIRERRFVDELVHLGLAFIPEESADFSSQEQAILQYVFAACAEMQGTLLPGRFGSGE
jgi:hypothetical protein